MQAATHRQVWMRCDTGQFAEKEVRQALAYTFDREQMIKTLFRDKADIGNDHVIAPLYPFFFDGLTQRTQDIEKAKSLLQAAGVATPVKATLHFGDLQEIPQLAQIIQVGAKEAGFDLAAGRREPGHLLRRAVVPGVPGRPALLGRSRARHRRLRPPRHARRLPQRRAGHERHLELLPVLLARVRRRLQGVPGSGRRRGPDRGLREDRDHPQRGRPGRPAVLLQLPVRLLEEVPGRTGQRPRADVPRPGVARSEHAPSSWAGGDPGPGAPQRRSTIG